MITRLNACVEKYVETVEQQAPAEDEIELVLEEMPLKTPFEQLRECFSQEVWRESQGLSATMRLAEMSTLTHLFLEGVRRSAFKYSDIARGNDDVGRIAVLFLSSMDRWLLKELRTPRDLTLFSRQ